MRSRVLEDRVLSHHQANAVRMVDRYWHQLAATGRLPRRVDVHPEHIEDALEYAFIGQQITGGYAKFRVAGDAVSAVLGMEVAGMPLVALIDPADRPLFNDTVSELFTNASVLTLSLKAPETQARSALEASLRLYPLSDADGNCTQVLGTFVSTGIIGQTPRRFRVADTVVTPRPKTGCAPIITRGHLRLVASNA